MTKFKSVTIALVALIAAFAATSEAKADTGWGRVGPWDRATVSCLWYSTGPLVVVGAPYVAAVPLSAITNDGTVTIGPFGTTHVQWVGYRANLYRVVNGVRVLERRGYWKRALVDDYGRFHSNVWINHETGTSAGAGDTYFYTSYFARYVVETEMYWWADQYVRDGGLSVGGAGYYTNQTRTWTPLDSACVFGS